jgi:hypothetical protein
MRCLHSYMPHLSCVIHAWHSTELCTTCRRRTHPPLCSAVLGCCSCSSSIDTTLEQDFLGLQGHVGRGRVDVQIVLKSNPSRSAINHGDSRTKNLNTNARFRLSHLFSNVTQSWSGHPSATPVPPAGGETIGTCLISHTPPYDSLRGVVSCSIERSQTWILLSPHLPSTSGSCRCAASLHANMRTWGRSFSAPPQYVERTRTEAS